MGSFIDPANSQFNDGAYLPGSKFFFYTAGTANALDTYSDEALSIANTNPVVADGQGRFGAIYLKRDSLYKIVLKDQNDNIIYTRDNVSAVVLANQGLETRLKQVASDPITQGAVGDGSADERTFVQAAIDLAAANGTMVVDLLGKTYRCDSQITVPNGVLVMNGDLDFTNDTGTDHILIQGTQNSSVSLDANLSRWAATASISDTSGCTVGDWVHLSDSQDVNYQGLGTHRRGFMAKIKSITTNTSITLENPSDIPVKTADAALCIPFSMKREVTLRDLNITSGTGSSTSVLTIDMARDVRVERCRFKSVPAYGITIRASGDVVVDDCQLETEVGSATSSQGVFIEEGSRNVRVRNNTIRGLDFGVISSRGDLEGIILDSRIEGNYICEAQNTAIAMDEGSHFTLVADNEIHSCSGGIRSRGGTIDVRGNTIVNNDSNLQFGVQLDCWMDETPSLFDLTGLNNITMSVTDNHFQQCYNPIDVHDAFVGTGEIGSVKITDNVINQAIGGVDTCIRSAIQTLAATISDNTILDAAGTLSISLSNAETAVVSGNNINQNSGGTGGIYVGDCVYCAITNNVVRRFTTATYACIQISGSAGTYNVVGNVLQGGDYGIEISSTATVYHAGNVFLAQGTGNITGTFTASRASGTAGNDGTIDIT